MLVPIGEAWVDPAEVVAVTRWDGDHVAILRSGAHVPTHTVVAPAELAAFATMSAPPPPAPAREVHPLLSAYLDVVRTVCAGGYVSGEQVTAWEAWHQAGFPIWAEP